MTVSIRTLLLSACIGLLTFAQGCTAPTAGTDAPEPARIGTEPTPLPQAPPMSDPLPPERMPSAVVIDYSCRADADCAVKNVGNCCGMMPACVNKGSPTDPKAVQAECARSGMSSTCGFVDIAACSCVSNRCEPQSSTGGVTR